MHEDWEDAVARRVKPLSRTIDGQRVTVPRCEKCGHPRLTTAQIERLMATLTPVDRVGLVWCTCAQTCDMAALKRRREVVYFVGNLEAGYVKVGYSQSPGWRIQALATAAPFALHKLATVRGPMKLERAIHRHLHEARSRGEWFHATPPVRELVAMAADGTLQRAFDAWEAQAAPGAKLDVGDLIRPKGLARFKKRG